MTDFICKLIHMIFSLIGVLVPKIVIDPAIMNNAQSTVSHIVDFVSAVNFLIPLPDIVLIVGICIALRSSLFLTFVGNWILRRILDVIP